MPDPYAMRMFMLVGTLLSAWLAAASPTAMARDAQDYGRGAPSQRRQLSNNLPVREIERRVIPRMPGAQYLGFDYDPATEVYTLKFLRNGSVIWVDVDGRDGHVIRSTGS